tara:strand:- start:37 stop:300 length:264 start_codon:yes stop_codon:yes gene_type:complete
MSKKITLKSGKKATLVEMSVDAFDKCMDSVEFVQKDGESAIKNQFALSTLWIRNGVDGADDKFIKSLSIEDRVELQLAIQDYNSLGE